jgi:hypothetical protein
MKQFTLEDLEYEGSHDSKHCWNLPDGQPCYWRQDWLHNAEDLMGIHPKYPDGKQYPSAQSDQDINIEDQAK